MTPQPTPEQLSKDLQKIEDCDLKPTAPVGARFWTLHDSSELQKPEEERWYRIWKKTYQGWTFDSMHLGNPRRKRDRIFENHS